MFDILTEKNRNRIAIFICFLFLLVYSSIALVNHYCFRTNALDMGYFLKAIYDFSLLRFHDFSISQMEMNCIFADHFNPSLIIIAPLRFIFGSYTLSILQIAFILLGAWGTYVFIRERSPYVWLPVLGLIHFGLMWGNFEALAYDFHDSIPGAMLLPWLLHFFLKKKWTAVVPLFLFMLGWKETMGVWIVFVAAGIGMLHPMEKEIRRAAILMGAFGFLWAMVATQIIIPSFDYTGRNYRHFDYGVLGDNPVDVVQTLVTHPGFAFKLIYTDHISSPFWWDLKKEMLLVFFAAGGLLLFLRPAFFLMAVPIILQKVWADDPAKWGLIWHYGIEFVPVVSIGIYWMFMQIRNRSLAYALAVLSIAANLTATCYVFTYRKPIYKIQETRKFYKASHYRQPFSVRLAHEAMRLIPDSASVSATQTALPHLALRKNIYLFPDTANADFIFAIDYWQAYPISYNELAIRLYNLKNNPEWEMLFGEENIYVFRRK